MSESQSQPKHGLRLIAWLLAGLVLALTFAAYLRGDVIVDLATRLWSCW